MRISHRYRFIFIAYPRTGSSTVGRVLDEYSDIAGGHRQTATRENPFYNHMKARELKAVFDERGWRWDEYRRFCFVRNPYDRAVSLFRHRLKISSSWDGKNRLRGNVNGILLRALPRRTAFAYFLATRSPGRGVAANLKAYTCDSSGDPLVPSILRFEEFSHELVGYANAMGIALSEEEVPHLNANPSEKDWRSYYNALTVRRVQQLYGEEIERFGYRMQERN